MVLASSLGNIKIIFILLTKIIIVYIEVFKLAVLKLSIKKLVLRLYLALSQKLS